MNPRFRAALIAPLVVATLTCVARAATTITLAVDATSAPRRLLHATLHIPAEPGPLTLLYPEWIPGEHGPTGPINDLGGLVMRANETALPWRRDSLDMYAFHVTVPDGAHAVEVSLDLLINGNAEGFSSGASTTANLLILSWNQILLYPQGVPAGDLLYDASVTLPAGWDHASALRVAKADGATVAFTPAPLVTLVDSPLIAGQYMRTIPLAPEITSSPHAIDMVADAAADLEMPQSQVDHLSRLVREIGVLFGARHYGHYDFLYTLSEDVPHFGLEHHESSDDRVRERAVVDDDRRLDAAGLLPHEMVHSWNGKYRRPADLTTRPFDEPMKTDLLWVYEGLTNYLGDVLTARCGLRTMEQARDDLALLVANQEAHKGRAWRNLLDTAVGAQILYEAPSEWSDRRRGTDFYDESNLLWLEADVLIRQKTKGARSLDDFCRGFAGGATGPPEVKTYTFDDVVNGLNAVAPNDWASFLTMRLTRTGEHAPVDGLTASGWRLAYVDSASEIENAHDGIRNEHEWSWSLGFRLDKDDAVEDVVPDSPGARAGLAPGVVLVAVNGRAYSHQILRDAVRAAKGTNAPIELLGKRGEFFDTFRIEYHDGEKHPRLVRIPSTPDLLTKILSPRVKPSRR